MRSDSRLAAGARAAWAVGAKTASTPSPRVQGVFTAPLAFRVDRTYASNSLDFQKKNNVVDCNTLMLLLCRASPPEESARTVRKWARRGQFRVVSALLSDQYFVFSRPDFTGRKGLVRGVQKWGGNQVPSNQAPGSFFYFLF